MNALPAIMPALLVLKVLQAIAYPVHQVLSSTKVNALPTAQTVTLDRTKSVSNATPPASAAQPLLQPSAQNVQANGIFKAMCAHLHAIPITSPIPLTTFARSAMQHVRNVIHL